MALEIKTATVDLAAALVAVYAPYVTDTSITFEYEVPSTEEFARRIAHTLERYPYLVAWWNDEPVGYAYAGCFKPRAAYDWSVEVSIYIRQDMHGHGIGKALYEALEACLKKQNVQNLNACITYPNGTSEAFHQALGYHKVAHFSQCGYKLGQWHDMIWMEKHIDDHAGSPSAFIPFSQLIY